MLKSHRQQTFHLELQANKIFTNESQSWKRRVSKKPRAQMLHEITDKWEFTDKVSNMGGQRGRFRINTLDTLWLIKLKIISISIESC
jgi:hypothetical protein